MTETDPFLLLASIRNKYIRRAWVAWTVAVVAVCGVVLVALSWACGRPWRTVLAATRETAAEFWLDIRKAW